MSSDDKDPLFLHPGMGHRIRKGTWRDHQRSTYDLCLQAIDAGNWKAAAELARYTVQEALEGYELYGKWAPEIRAYLEQQGVCDSVVEQDVAALETRLAAADCDEGWRRYRGHIDDTVTSCRREDADRAKRSLEKGRVTWLKTHDDMCDRVQGMLAIAAERLGEHTIGPLWDLLMAPMIASYDRYHTNKQPWSVSADTLLQTTAEALRGHLSGHLRRGDIEYVEEDGRRGFRFTPCGSGGRNFAGASADAFPLTSDAHPWAWNTKGVCLYCAHCCVLSERNPIERLGHPARVVEPPYRNDEGSRDYCTWWIYDDPSAIPDEIYRRTGNQKPLAQDDDG